MLNYVNSAYDKVLKPCDAQQFQILTQSYETERLITLHRGGDTRAKAKLPALTYMGVLDEAKYKDYLKQCEAQGTKPLGSRRAEFMRPTGLLMLDFDHVGDARALWERISDIYTRSGADMTQCVALAHVTPSGDGLRLVLRRTKGVTVEEDQHAWCQVFGGIKCDDVCKDISRLSFAPMQSEVLYYNPSLLFVPLPDAEDYPDGTLFSGVSQTLPTPQPEVVPEGNTTAAADYDTEYQGIAYAEIVKRLEEQLGGRPEHGARNSFIFSMACNLRYICNDDAQWIAAILPTYGEDPQKHRTTIQSAVNRPMSRTMPETMSRALRIATLGDDTNSASESGQARPSAVPPAMPGRLPELMDLLTSRSPERARAAVAMSVFPPLGAHLQEVKLAYWDGRDYEPTFMNVLAAELSVGKSAVNLPIEYIIADIEARDDVARGKEAAWKERCATLKTTEDKPTRPKGLAVQSLASDMTNAAFVQRLADAEGKYLYTQMDEIELLNGLKTNGASDTVSAILRLAFDCGKYGQERVASNAINAKVRVRWNWNASTTVQRVRKFFSKNIADGTLSRLSFSTIIKDEDDWGEQRPKFEQYGQPFADALAPYIDRLTTCKGTLHCPEAIDWAERMCDEQVAYARELDDRTYAQFSYRAVLMGFFRAMVLYIAHGMQWSEEIAQFCAWTVRYDMWCKMRFFRDMMHKDMEAERAAVQRGPASLLAMLPEEFTREQVKELRMAQGLEPNPKHMLSAWKKRGFVVFDESRGIYAKVDSRQ